jgi:hypothetical protein
MKRRSPLLILAVLVLAVAARYWDGGDRDASVVAGGDSPDGNEMVRRAYAEERSDLWVTVSGRVLRTLADDDEGSRHQRFIVELSPDITLLVAHNIDLADRVPLTKGDGVTVSGEYEWNRQGGVIHWTHHDPQGRRDGGWIEHRGVTYR